MMMKRVKQVFVIVLEFVGVMMVKREDYEAGSRYSLHGMM